LEKKKFFFQYFNFFRHSVKDWLACYEKDLCDMVVPRSAESVFIRILFYHSLSFQENEF